MNYDAWFDYIEIVEAEGDLDVVRDTYERAIANIPPAKVRVQSTADENVDEGKLTPVIVNLYSHRRRSIGKDTFIFGYITRFLKNYNVTISNAPDKCIKLVWKYCLINNLRLPKFRYYMQILKFVNGIWIKLGKY